MFHSTHTQVLRITSAVLYRVRYQASLPCQKIHTYAAGKVMQI